MHTLITIEHTMTTLLSFLERYTRGAVPPAHLMKLSIDKSGVTKEKLCAAIKARPRAETDIKDKRRQQRETAGNAWSALIALLS